MQMQESRAKCPYRSSALGLFPALLDLETHALSDSPESLPSCWGGFTQAVLPALEVM